MPQIIPIRDLKNTAEISNLCHETREPVYITKNGYGDMVIMSMETYEKSMFLQDVYRKIEEGEADIAAGRTIDAWESLKKLREKHSL
jgi:PHD/YefM family antitoxin component YafN of YafNO toxin-antitoxin module